MINFRYHIVSLVAVFLALGIGIIMGTAVIDSAVVDRLEAQQRGLESDIRRVRADNADLRAALRDERQRAAALAEQGSERLLDGALLDVPVLAVAAPTADTEALDDLVTTLARADADHRGTLSLTDRFALSDEEAVRDLADLFGAGSSASADSLRATAVNRLALALRPLPGPVSPGDDASGTAPADDGEPPAPAVQPDLEAPPLEGMEVLRQLIERGFLEFQPPEDAVGAEPAFGNGTRIVVMSHPAADDLNEQLVLPLIRGLVRSASAPQADVLAVSTAPPDEEDAEDGSFLLALRESRDLGGQVSTVDNVDTFVGRLAAVLALVDLGDRRYGHYGTGPGAQRLLPAPVE